MNTSNDSLALADKSQHDTTTAPIIADDDILKLFNIEKTDIQEFRIKLQDDALYIRIRLNAKYHQCPVCGQMTKKIKDYTQKKIVHSILSFRNCYILYEARRYQCPHCKKIFYENNPFAFGSSRISVATVYNILRDLKSPNETFTSVAKRYDISVTSAINIFDTHIHMSRRPLPECIGIDEVYAFKTHDSQYVCVLVDTLNQKIIDVLPSRHKNDLMNYFTLIPREEREKVRFCSFDMWSTYRIVAKHVFPNVTCCVDHFHIIQELNKRLDSVRISIQRKYQLQVNELSSKKKDKTITREELLLLEEASRHYYVLKKFNWLFFSSNNKIFDPNIEKKYNQKLEGYYNYYDLIVVM